MIKAILNVTNTGSISLSIKGHAGASEAGQDIICASASILAYTAAQLVKDYGERNLLKKKPTITMRKGSSTITCTPKSDYFDEVFHSFFVVQTGLNLLAHSYPQYVDIKMFGET